MVNQFARWTEKSMRSIWVQPKQLIQKNVREICEFSPFTTDDIAVVDGTAKQVKRAMSSGAKILLMGPDRFKLSVNLAPSDFKALDVDELHMCFGGAESSRSLVFEKTMQNMVESVMMTGTLVNGRLDTAFTAINAIDPRFYPLGLASFLNDHALCDGFGRPYHWHNHDKLRKILGQFGIYRTFESVFGKQEIVMQVEWLTMNARQREAYDEFEATAILELEQFIVDGTLPGVATIRARQIMEHPNRFPNLMDPKLPPVDICPGEQPSKMDAIDMHFDDHYRLKTPVIVFASMIQVQHMLVERAKHHGLRVGALMGETSASGRDTVDREFTSGGLNTLVCSDQIGTVGYNWQFCGDQEVDHVMNTTLGYLDSVVTQGFRRAIRQKRRSPLRVTTLAYQNSLDPKIMAIIERKSRDAHLAEPTREVLRFEGEQP